MEKQVRIMYSDIEIERWFLGLPFEADGKNTRPAAVTARIERPAAVVEISDEDVERFYLGLPAKAA